MTLAGSGEPKKGTLPLLRRRSTPQNTVSVKAEMTRGKTYPFTKSNAMPPETRTVAMKIMIAAISVEKIETMTIL